MNQVILIGRLTRDVDLLATSSGLSVANFNLAVDKKMTKEKKAEYESQGKATADFIPIKAFGKTAEVANQYLSQGSKIAVRGSLDVNHYTDSNGTKKTFTSVLVEELKFLESAGSKQGGSANQVSDHDAMFDEMYQDISGPSDLPF